MGGKGREGRVKLFALDIEISFSRSNRGSFPLFSTSICNDFFLPQNAASTNSCKPFIETIRPLRRAEISVC